MSQQLISIAVGGAMTGLQLKRGLDLRQFGNANIVRSSLIEWDEGKQKWFIQLLNPHAVVTQTMLHQAGVEVPSTADCDFNAGCGILFFDEYEDAVVCEVEVIQAIRLKKGVEAVA